MYEVYVAVQGKCYPLPMCECSEHGTVHRSLSGRLLVDRPWWRVVAAHESPRWQSGRRPWLSLCLASQTLALA